MFVGVCSSSVWPIGEGMMSFADCVPKPTIPLSLRIVFSLSFRKPENLSSLRIFQPSSMKIIIGVPSIMPSMRWKM